MKLNVVEILRNLPKPNCKECGEPTCMIFATKLIKKEKVLGDCKPLFTTEHSEQRKKLEEILGTP